MLTRCSCGVETEPPWRGHDLPWSLASVVCGVLLIGLGVAAIVADLHPWVGYAIITVLLASVVSALVVQALRHHRGGCWLWRATWFGVAAPGIALRLVFGWGAW